VDSIKNEYLKQLMDDIFDHEFFSRFSNAPAAKTWHHNYLGGLLEHSVCVAKICDFAASMYHVDRDLVVVGGLLHDVGKVFEYTSHGAIDFTPEGRLLGHIGIGDQLICKYAAKIDNFPQNLLMKLRHLILSHHGEYEKASARLPQTIEAIVLHFADNLDAQTIGVKQLIDPVKNSTSVWSEFDKLNNRFYYVR
jgi:3'-5' exoribonuclease